jgi:preprotein translocase subunit YajC
MIDIDVSKIVSEIGEPKARLIENEDQKQRKMYLWISSFVFLFILLVGTLMFFFLSRGEAATAALISKDINNLNQGNATMASAEIKAKFIQQRNKDILNIIKANPNWSYVFETLEEVVPKGITFSRFEVNSPTSMTIAGISPDYETLSKLAVSMSDFTISEGGKDIKVFGNVSVTNASLIKSQDGKITVDFTVSFNFIKKINKESVNPVSGETPAVAPTTTPTPEPTTPEVTPTPTPAPETPTPTPAPETTPPPTPTPTPPPAPEAGPTL